jgi:hypothetical protein
MGQMCLFLLDAPNVPQLFTCSGSKLFAFILCITSISGKNLKLPCLLAVRFALRRNQGQMFTGSWKFSCLLFVACLCAYMGMVISCLLLACSHGQTVKSCLMLPCVQSQAQLLLACYLCAGTGIVTSCLLLAGVQAQAQLLACVQAQAQFLLVACWCAGTGPVTSCLCAVTGTDTYCLCVVTVNFLLVCSHMHNYFLLVCSHRQLTSCLLLACVHFWVSFHVSSFCFPFLLIYRTLRQSCAKTDMSRSILQVRSCRLFV